MSSIADCRYIDRLGARFIDYANVATELYSNDPSRSRKRDRSGCWRNRHRLQACSHLDPNPNPDPNPHLQRNPDPSLDPNKTHLPGCNDQDADVGLRGAADHVRHVVLVPRGVQDGVPLRLRLEVRPPDLCTGNTASTLHVKIAQPRSARGQPTRGHGLDRYLT